MTMFNYLLGIGALLVISGKASATIVTFDNQSGEKLCFAEGTSHREVNGPESIISGFNCVESGSILTLDPFDGAEFVSILDIFGHDFLEFGTLPYRMASSWVPAPTVASFELDVMQFDSGGYSYSFALGDDGLSNWHPVGSSDDLTTLLNARGFHKVKSLILDSAALGASTLIRLGQPIFQ